MRGLTVRWSLVGAPADVSEQLQTYVTTSSHDRFTGMDGLSYKTWRTRPGEWFEGTYVFVTDSARAAFQADFTKDAAESPGSRIIGSAPILIEPYEVVAVAEGAAGFVPASDARTGRS